MYVEVNQSSNQFYFILIEFVITRPTTLKQLRCDLDESVGTFFFRTYWSNAFEKEILKCSWNLDVTVGS